MHAVLTTVAALLLIVSATLSCGDNPLDTPAGAIVGRSGNYNYSPSVILDGDEERFWWCGRARNPDDSKQDSDAILYETVNVRTKVKSKPVVVLAETANAWDARFTCNPRVVRGRFVNPLGDNQTYSYAMFYVGSLSGLANSIGEAFSNDGLVWKKVPVPVIASTSADAYGVGQPAVLNVDGGSHLVLLYEDFTPNTHHVRAESLDGVHFTVTGQITQAGLDPANAFPSWGDAGYDPKTQSWYAIFNQGIRDQSTTGGVQERGQYGIQLYRIPDSALLDGSTPWQLLKTIDTNSTGYEANFLPSLLHDGNGNINVGSYPVLPIFLSTSLPRPKWNASATDAADSADIFKWAIVANSYDPGQTIVPLRRFKNSDTTLDTTGWVDPQGGFAPAVTLGHVYTAPQSAASQAIYACESGTTGFFTSTDPTCGGQRILGLQGYGAAQPTANATVALYLCQSTAPTAALSADVACGGAGHGKLLAYVLP